MKTKERILAVAREMIAEKGFHSTTTALLASETGISEGTIYRHFQSKEDILVTILSELDERYSRFMGALGSEGDGREGTLERVLEAHFDFVAENLHAIRIMVSSFALLPPSKQSMTSVIDRMRAFTAETLRRSMKLGVIREVDPEATANVLVAMLLGLIEMRLYWPETPDFSAQAVAFCRQALVKAL